MEDNARMLLDASSSSHYRESASPVQVDVNFRAVHGNGLGAAVIRGDGSFTWLPEAKEPVASSDIVSAVKIGTDAFSIWYCPSNGKSGPNHRRNLQKTGTFTCESPRSADEAVHLLQKLNCWWGRENPPRILVFVNPVSGSGKSTQVWKHTCHPILKEAGLEIEVVETQYSKHAFNTARDIPLKGMSAIACVGGDGTMSEILQGLFRRSDWAEAIQIPLCLVPGGTGNGMSASVGMWTPVMAAHALCKGKVRKMDIVSVLQAGQEPQFSFLSTTYGFIANVDIGTENLRFLGLLRNQVGAVKEILKGGAYSAHVATVSSTAATELWSKRMSPAGSGNKNRPATPLLDSLGDLQSLPPLQCASLPQTQADYDNLLQGWQLMEMSSFSLFVVSVSPWLALDFSLIPSESIDSGEMTLTGMSGQISRLKALQTLLKADTGRIEEIPELQLEKIAAFIIEPNAADTWLVMDGEVLPLERMFAELHPGLCKAIVAD